MLLEKIAKYETKDQDEILEYLVLLHIQNQNTLLFNI